MKRDHKNTDKDTDENADVQLSRRVSPGVLVFHWNGTDFFYDEQPYDRDRYARLTPEDKRTTRFRLRLDMLCRADSVFGRRDLALIALACAMGNFMDRVVVRLNDLIRRDADDDPTPRDLLALCLLDLLPRMPRGLYLRMRAWHEWQFCSGFDSKLYALRAASTTGELT